ncbi:MAG: SDR family NAD(P)-dependent oxidoreductase [Acidobacteriota bacterium]
MNSTDNRNKLALVTGGSTGLGLELAKCCAHDGFDLLIAADEPEIFVAADSLRELGVSVQAVMIKGDGDVVSGWRNELRSAIANITPAGVLAEMHRSLAEPGSGGTS